MTPTRVRLVATLAADALCIVIFSAIGRRSHDEADGAEAVLATAAPFLVALALGWAMVAALRRSHGRPGNMVHVDAGVVIWVVTAGAGLILRRTLWDRGTALAFVIVATTFLGASIVGWRVAYARVRRSRAHLSQP